MVYRRLEVRRLQPTEKRLQPAKTRNLVARPADVAARPRSPDPRQDAPQGGAGAPRAILRPAPVFGRPDSRTIAQAAAAPILLPAGGPAPLPAVSSAADRPGVVGSRRPRPAHSLTRHEMQARRDHHRQGLHDHHDRQGWHGGRGRPSRSLDGGKAGRADSRSGRQSRLADHAQRRRAGAVGAGRRTDAVSRAVLHRSRPCSDAAVDRRGGESARYSSMISTDAPHRARAGRRACAVTTSPVRPRSTQFYRTSGRING